VLLRCYSYQYIDHNKQDPPVWSRVVYVAPLSEYVTASDIFSMLRKWYSQTPLVPAMLNYVSILRTPMPDPGPDFRSPKLCNLSPIKYTSSRILMRQPRTAKHSK
jgi:hypothetical protein